MKPATAFLLVAILAGAGALAIVANRPPAKIEPATYVGGPFSLTDGTGKTVTDRDFRGKFMLVYFGYTHCPDACPTTLGDLATAIDKLPAADRAQLVPVFITVDPARDTSKVMGDYARAFGPEFVGLTGTPEALRILEGAYHVYAEKHPLAHGDYAMDHTSIIYVIGPDGNFVGVISDDTKPDEIARRLRAFGV